MSAHLRQQWRQAAMRGYQRGFGLDLKSRAQEFLAALNGGNRRRAAQIVVDVAHQADGGVGAWWSHDRAVAEMYSGHGHLMRTADGGYAWDYGSRVGVILAGDFGSVEPVFNRTMFERGTPITIGDVEVYVADPPRPGMLVSEGGRWESLGGGIQARAHKVAWQPFKPPSGMRITTGGDAVPGGYNGYFILWDEATGEKMGYLDYQSAPGYGVGIAMVKTEPKYRRQGVASILLRALRHEFPDEEVDPGQMTPEGHAWWNSVRHLVAMERCGIAAIMPTLMYRGGPMIYAAENAIRKDFAAYGIQPLYTLEACERLFREVLKRERVPQADEAYAIWSDDPKVSKIGWLRDPPGGPWTPILVVGRAMTDPLTVIHEAAHVVVNKGRLRATPEEAHTSVWQATYLRILGDHYRLAAQMLRNLMEEHMWDEVTA